MGQFSKWLLHEDQKELFEVVVAAAFNIIFLVLVALLLWLLGKPTLAFRLAKGYAILWVITFLTAVLASRIQGFFRVSLYDHPNAYVISNLIVSCFLQAGWSAFAALTVHSFVPGASISIAVLLYIVGILSCVIAYFVVASCYQGHIYKFVILPLAVASFVVFSVWPTTALVTYGWFFQIF